MNLVHGRPSAYNHGGCRCDACTDANTAAQYARNQQRRDRLALAPVEHGSRSTASNYGCDCAPCAEARRRDIRRRYQTNSGAANNRKGWTSHEIEMIIERQSDNRRYLRSARECAELLGRSIGAVDTMRKKAQRDPKYMNLVHLQPDSR